MLVIFNAVEESYLDQLEYDETGIVKLSWSKKSDNALDVKDRNVINILIQIDNYYKSVSKKLKLIEVNKMFVIQKKSNTTYYTGQVAEEVSQAVLDDKGKVTKPATHKQVAGWTRDIKEATKFSYEEAIQTIVANWGKPAEEYTTVSVGDGV